ncbi:hypothetical protein [Vibrio cortegadensis]|uniref:hypothetical protein n=1 Tax=Vibrio cortegadensis TaxID=1328770 RepID=UPI00352C6FF3
MKNGKSAYDHEIKGEPLHYWVGRLKTYIQFIIGGLLILILVLKGSFELIDTFVDAEKWEYPIYSHFLLIDTFTYIGSALAISAGIDLGYMLFTKGPDEALEPLLLGITSAAFFTLAQNPSGSWVIILYTLSILILLFCMKKYKEWELDEEND